MLNNLPSPFLSLAPMAGLTGSAVRKYFRNNGVDLVFTEMISIQALARSHKKTISLLNYGEEERPIAAQLFGNELKYFVESAKRIRALGFDMLDLNCGCPAKRIVKNKNGVVLMQSPEAVGEIIDRIKEETSLPVSIKLRLGIKKTDELILNFLDKIKGSKVDLITVHLRYAEDFHKGEPDFKLVREIRNLIKVRFVINGGIDSPEKAENILKNTYCDGLMLGRPALENLNIFTNIKNHLAGKKLPRPASGRNYFGEILDFYKCVSPENHLGRMKKLVPYVLKNIPNIKELRMELFSVKKTDDFIRELEERANLHSF